MGRRTRFSRTPHMIRAQEIERAARKVVEEAEAGAGLTVGGLVDLTHALALPAEGGESKLDETAGKTLTRWIAWLRADAGMREEEGQRNEASTERAIANDVETLYARTDMPADATEPMLSAAAAVFVDLSTRELAMIYRTMSAAAPARTDRDGVIESDAATDKNVMWNLRQAMQTARELQELTKVFDWYVALGGGVLHKGKSQHDLDLIMVPAYGANIDKLYSVLLSQGWRRVRTAEQMRAGWAVPDTKHVEEWLLNQKRVDLIILRTDPAQDATAKIVAEIASERQRQISVEGWTPEHDAKHADGELAQAAATYAFFGTNAENNQPAAETLWPASWSLEWWKPKNPRFDLIRAAALIVAEIERLDRRGEHLKETKNG